MTTMTGLNTTTKSRKNRCLLPYFSCFTDWKYLHRNNCLRDKNHEKPHQLLHRKHGHVRSAVPGFVPLGSLHWLLAHEFSFTKESSSPSRWVSLIVCKGRTKPLDSSRPLNITICQFVSYCCISLWFSWPLFTQSSFRISGVTRYEASNQTA